MTEDSAIIKQLQVMDFAGTTLISASLMALPYVVFLAVVFGGMDLLLDRIMPTKIGGGNWWGERGYGRTLECLKQENLSIENILIILSRFSSSRLKKPWGSSYLKNGPTISSESRVIKIPKRIKKILEGISNGHGNTYWEEVVIDEKP
jgi:hypothetical protein